MQHSVLTLGEKIVLAARLASIEHVRQELDALARAAEASECEAWRVGDPSTGFTDESDAIALSQPLPVLLHEVFNRIERHDAQQKGAA